MNNPILSIECNEPEGLVTRHVRPTEMTVEKIGDLWDKISKFDSLFNDFVRGDFASFLAHFVTQVGPKEFEAASLCWDVDDVGILILNDLRPGVSASAHFIFWDMRLKGREELLRRMIEYVFDRYEFRRIETQVPVRYYLTMAGVEKLGFIKEGRIREAYVFNDVWYDVNIYGIIREDLTNPPTKKYRQVCLNCGTVEEAK